MELTRTQGWDCRNRIIEILILLCALLFAGCGKGTEERGDLSSKMTEGTQNPAVSADAGADLFLSLEDLPWRDNSLDAYSAAVSMPLRYTEPKGALGGGAQAYILGNSSGSVFKKHLFEEAADCWDEIKAVTDQEVETSFRLAFWEGTINQVWAAGSIAGSDHYMMMMQAADADRERLYRFFETDENMQVLNSFYVDCLDGNNLEIPTQLQVDAQGNIHMIAYNFSNGTNRYYIVAPDGTFLMEVSPKEGFPEGQTPDLFSLYDGRVGMRFAEQLKYADVETGTTKVLANIKSNYRCCILWDEKTLLYADGKGLYRSGLSGENPELLYTWFNHGIAASKIEAMQVTESGGISLIYQDSKGANYLRLEPTTEEVEIQEITFAVSFSEKYQAMVAAFNKKHPAYRIKMETYNYNDTGLRTKMIAGNGPVLVTAPLVGFENNAEWWEPLDEVFRQMKLDDELIARVLDAGKINGTIYGVVTDFSINSVVTFAEESDKWDYDAFLDCFDEDDPAMKSVLNGLNGSDGYAFIASFFYHGLKEKYLFDAEDCTTRFDSEEFRKILKLGRLFMDKERWGTSEDLRQGTSPCAVAYIDEPGDLACLRIWGGNKLKFIGYPSDEGSRHYLMGSDPITVSVNATAEEKRLAHSFIRFILSYDAQMEAVLDTNTSNNFAMSARKDVLQEQINRMDEDFWTGTHGFTQFYLEDRVDNELDGATLYGLLEKAEPKQYMPRELSHIFLEELDAYLSGNLTEDILIEHLENRVGTYLAEQK